MAKIGEPERHWAWDFRIPIVIVFTIALQTAGGIWAASSYVAMTNNRLDVLESFREATDIRVSRVEDRQGKFDTIIGRMDERLISLDRIITRLERLQGSSHSGGVE